MNDYWAYVGAAYGVAILTIGALTARIILDYRRLRAALARYGAAGARDEGEAS